VLIYESLIVPHYGALQRPATRTPMLPARATHATVRIVEPEMTETSSPTPDAGRPGGESSTPTEPAAVESTWERREPPQAVQSPGAWPGWAATAPSAWGGSVPPPSGPPVRRPIMLVSASMLAVGLALGAVGTIIFARGTARTATMLFNDSPVKTAGPNAGTAVSVAQQLGPAVGTIIVKQGSGNALGSGFVIAHDGAVSYLLTNNHVVNGATDLHVVMPGGRNLKATIVGTDSFDDLAVVSVPDSSLPVATFGASKGLVVGQAVVAIGSPLGNEGSVTAGVISALHRTITAGSDINGQTENLQDVLQTDASINQGNSGGPLADTDGRVIGVNVAIAGGASNIGFSIPADLAQQVAQELISHEKVQHPYLGVSYLTSIEAVEAGQGFDGPGVLVRDVRSGSPAEKAGFQKNDILQAVGSTPIDNGATLGGLIQQHKVGDSVDFTVKRGGNVIHLTASLTDRPSSA
jgi:putative serine protease PepD